MAKPQITWTPSTQYDTGTVSSLDLDDQGNCLETHVGGTRLYYRVGEINNSGKNIDFGKSTSFANGTVTNIALASDGNFVEVHVSKGKLYSRVAQANFKNKTIKWRHGTPYDQYSKGSYCCIAIDDQDNCIEIHISSSDLYYRVGKVDFAGKDINWSGHSTKFDNGSYTQCSVALDTQGNCIETHVGRGRLYCRVGKLNGDTVTWGESTQYDKGSVTNIALGERGDCIETHVKDNRLYYRLGKLNTDNQTIEWGESTQYSENDRQSYKFTNIALNSQDNCFQTHVIAAGSRNNLFYRSTQIQSNTTTLWQIGKENARNKAEHKTGSWEKQFNYTVGMDAEPIDNPDLPELIAIAEEENSIFCAKSIQVYFTLEQSYAPDCLTLFYGYFGEEENRVFLDGQLLCKDFGISSTDIRHNRIPFPRIEAGEHILKITTIGKRKGYHTIGYLRLDAVVGELEPAPIIGLYDVVMQCSG